MDLAEQLLPEPAAVEGLELDGTNVEALRELLRQLVAQFREQRPAPDAAEETALLERVSTFGLEAARLVGPAFANIFRAGLDAGMRDLLRREFDTADTERKLALRQLEQAAHTFGVLMESFGAVLSTVSRKTVAAALQESTMPVIPQGPARIVARFQIELLVAWECIDAPLNELTFWVFRAVTSARKVEALPPGSLFGELRGELARVRARNAWQDWDQQDIETELAPWPPTTRSR